MWDEITYLFLNVNGAAVEAKERMNNFISHFACGGLFIHVAY